MDLKSGYPFWAIRNGLLHAFPPLRCDLRCDVAVLGAGSLMQLVTHKDQRIESPRELRGKTVTVLSYTDTTYYALLGMMSKVKLTKADVKIQAAGPAGVWQQFLDVLCHL